MNRPRLRNVPRGSLLSTEVTRGKNSNQRSKIFSYRRVIEKKQNRILFSFFPVFSQSLPRLMEKCYTSSGKIFPLDVLALTLCTENQQVQVRLKRKTSTSEGKIFFRQTCNNFPSDVVFKNYKYFLDFTPQKFFLFDFSLNHGILSIFCATKKKK